MSVWRLTSPGHARDALVKQLLTICLLGLGAGIIFWLSGGIPPRTWRVLLQSCLHFNSLWAQQGAGMLLPFIIVVVQSILVGVAWAVFGWLAYREGSALFALLTTQQSHSQAAKSPRKKMIAASQPSRPALMAPGSSGTPSASLKQASSPSASLHKGAKRGQSGAPVYGQQKEQMPPQSSEAMFPFAPPFKEDWFLPPDLHEATTAERSNSGDSLWLYEDDRVKNPFEDEAVMLQKSLELKAMVAPAKREEPAYIPPFGTPQPPTGVQQYYTMTDPFSEMDDVGALHSSARKPSIAGEASRAIEESSLEEPSAPCEEGDFASVLNSFGFLPHQDVPPQDETVAKESPAPVEELPVAKPAPVKKTPIAKPVTNPFDVQEQRLSGSGENFVLGDPFAVKEQPPSVFATEPYLENTAGEQAPVQTTSEHGFLFGNPFDGPLPEVYQHDEDLKQRIASSKGKPAAPPSNAEDESENTDNKPVKRKRSRGKRGNGTSRANQKTPDQTSQEAE